MPVLVCQVLPLVVFSVSQVFCQQIKAFAKPRAVIIIEWMVKYLSCPNEVLIYSLSYEVYNEYRIHLTSKIMHLFPGQTEPIELRFTSKLEELK